MHTEIRSIYLKCIAIDIRNDFIENMTNKYVSKRMCNILASRITKTAPGKEFEIKELMQSRKNRWNLLGEDFQEQIGSEPWTLFGPFLDPEKDWGGPGSIGGPLGPGI